EVVDGKRAHPHRDALVPLEESGKQEQRGAQGRGRREAEKRAAPVGIIATDNRGEDEMKNADEEVRGTDSTASPPNAPGTAKPTPSMAPIAASIASRTPPSSTSLALVNQAYPGPRPPNRGENEHP